MELVAGKIQRSVSLAGVAEGNNLTVTRRIMGNRHVVAALPDDLTVLDNDASERPVVALSHLAARQVDDALHGIGLVHCCLTY